MVERQTGRKVIPSMLQCDRSFDERTEVLLGWGESNDEDKKEKKPTAFRASSHPEEVALVAADQKVGYFAQQIEPCTFGRRG